VHFHINIAALTILLTGCASHAVTPGDTTGPETWGASDNVTHIENLYFSGQVDIESLQMARMQGVTTIINSRYPSEMDWDEKSAAENLGLEYISIPISKTSDTFDPQTIARIDTMVGERKGQKILMHCSSGNRVAAWYAIHLVDKQNMKDDEAIDVARRNGLTREGMESRVHNYLDKNDR
jgi:protein tyrosine phosphatase (PTP) superfamily phosphohydrolase (DUF442 family)